MFTVALANADILKQLIVQLYLKMPYTHSINQCFSNHELPKLQCHYEQGSDPADKSH